MFLQKPLYEATVSIAKDLAGYHQKTRNRFCSAVCAFYASRSDKYPRIPPGHQAVLQIRNRGVTNAKLAIPTPFRRVALVESPNIPDGNRNNPGSWGDRKPTNSFSNASPKKVFGPRQPNSTRSGNENTNGRAHSKGDQPKSGDLLANRAAVTDISLKPKLDHPDRFGGRTALSHFSDSSGTRRIVLPHTPFREEQSRPDFVEKNNASRNLSAGIVSTAQSSAAASSAAAKKKSPKKKKSKSSRSNNSTNNSNRNNSNSEKPASVKWWQRQRFAIYYQQLADFHYWISRGRLYLPHEIKRFSWDQVIPLDKPAEEDRKVDADTKVDTKSSNMVSGLAPDPNVTPLRMGIKYTPPIMVYEFSKNGENFHREIQLFDFDERMDIKDFARDFKNKHLPEMNVKITQLEKVLALVQKKGEVEDYDTPSSSSSAPVMVPARRGEIHRSGTPIQGGPTMSLGNLVAESNTAPTDEPQPKKSPLPSAQSAFNEHDLWFSYACFLFFFQIVSNFDFTFRNVSNKVIIFAKKTAWKRC